MCGVLGLTNWSGFAFYCFVLLLSSISLYMKVGADGHKKYFVSLSALTTDGFVAGLMSYVLFWTLVKMKQINRLS